MKRQINKPAKKTKEFKRGDMIVLGNMRSSWAGPYGAKKLEGYIGLYMGNGRLFHISPNGTPGTWGVTYRSMATCEKIGHLTNSEITYARLEDIPRCD